MGGGLGARAAGGPRPGRFDCSLRELSGSLGDLATFLPLAVGLIVVNGVNATALFLSAGLLYFAAGLYYGIPVPVQPLKATAAIAIATGASPETIAATALGMGLLLSAGALLDLNGFLAKVFTRPVVRGVQLGLGIILVRGGLSIAAGGPAHGGATLAHCSAPAAAAIGTAVAGIIVFSRGSRRYPAALIVMIFGILCGLALSSFRPPAGLSLGAVAPALRFPGGADLYAALVVLLLPQLPLTIANSVVATADAARQYYGERAERVTPRALAATLGIANIFAGFIGGMPVCHGSGGVTAHYRFGARTGGANLLIGSAFVAVALLLGRSVPALFGLIPAPVVGVLLVYVGVEHARLVRDVLDSRFDGAVVAAMGLLTLATGNLAVAALCGVGLVAAGERILGKSAVGGVAD